MPIDASTLQAFIIRAKKATYVGNGAKASSSRPGSHDLTYEEGPWSYRDSYFGGTDFIGQETVWHAGTPVWSMCYYGYIIRPELITPTEAGDLLKVALASEKSQGRLIDNLTHSSGKMHYAVSCEGTVEHFRGRETIRVGGNVDSDLAYALDYFGGLIKE